MSPAARGKVAAGLLGLVTALAGAAIVAEPALTACTPMPPSPDPGAPDVQGSVQCLAACQKLAALGCREGDATCEPTCARATAQHLVPMDVSCIATSGTKEQVRACAGIGSQGCP